MIATFALILLVACIAFMAGWAAGWKGGFETGEREGHKETVLEFEDTIAELAARAERGGSGRA